MAQPADTAPDHLGQAPPGAGRPPGERPGAVPAVRHPFHRRVARLMGLLALAAVTLLVAVVWLAGRGLMVNGMRLRAEGVAASTAAAMPQAGAPFDAAGWADRVRRATTDAVLVLVRDQRGAEVGRAEVAEPAAGVVVAVVPLPADAAVPLGSVEVRLDRTRLAGLLGSAVGVAAVAGLLLVLAAAWIGSRAARRMSGPAAEVASAASRMAAGDLRVHLEAQGADEMAEVASHVGALGRGLARMVADLRAAAAQVERATEAIAATSRVQVTAVAGQTAALEETASTVAEIASASRLATESAQVVIEVAERSENVWREGEAAVRGGMAGLSALEGRVGSIAEAVTELSDRTVQIAGIIAVVKDLAEQSNVLALNAAIEAAKVGEAGQGFAVVAEEMRRLSTQSHRATDEVRAMLGELQRATRKVVVVTGDGSAQARAAVQASGQASTAIGGLARAIEESSRAARGIADTTRRQTEEMERIATSVQYLHANMGETLAGARRIEEVAADLNRVSRDLVGVVGAYRV